MFGKRIACRRIPVLQIRLDFKAHEETGATLVRILSPQPHRGFICRSIYVSGRLRYLANRRASLWFHLGTSQGSAYRSGGAEVLMTLIEAYEEEHHSIPDASAVEVLRSLMDANDLRQKDLVPVFGSDSIVSEILHKKRSLNKTHILKLSKRFHVSHAVFF